MERKSKKSTGSYSTRENVKRNLFLGTKISFSTLCDAFNMVKHLKRNT